MVAFIVLVLVALLVIIFLAKSLKIIPQSSTMVIERLGRYNRTLPSGINLIIPIIDKPRCVVWDLPSSATQEKKHSAWIDLREQIYDYPKQQVITKDNVNVEIDALLYFQIIDPEKAVYEISNLTRAIEMLTQTTLRNVLGELELDESLTSRDTINIKLRNILDEATDKWGVKVNRVELKDITPPQSIQEEMEKQMKAERERRATILIAEGEKQAKILEAQGYQEAIERIKAALGDESEYAKYLLATKYIETLGEMVSGKDNKVVYMPYEATSVLGSIGGIKDLFDKA